MYLPSIVLYFHSGATRRRMVGRGIVGRLSAAKRNNEDADFRFENGATKYENNRGNFGKKM